MSQDLYNITDILLLLCVVVNMYKSMIFIRQNFVMLPLFLWVCALKITWMKLELVTSTNIILGCKNGIKEGITIVVSRCSETNTQYEIWQI